MDALRGPPPLLLRARVLKSEASGPLTLVADIFAEAYGSLQALFGLGFRVLPLSLSLYTLLLIVSAVTYGKPATPLFGFPRYILVAFPLFITLAALLESRRAMAAWLSLSTAVSLSFCAFFVSWRFVA